MLPTTLLRCAKHACFVLVLATLTVRTLQAPFVEFGDGREYILQTQSIVLAGTIAIDPAQIGHYWNQTNPYGVTLTWTDSPTPAPVGSMYQGNFGALYWARDRSLRFIHSWVYSAVVAPVYAFLHVASPGRGEYFAFSIANLIFIFVPVTLLWRMAPSWAALAFLIVVFMSPITPHLAWAHSELFCFFCASMAFVLLAKPRRRILGPLLLGVGAAQNPPIAMLLPLHLLLTLRMDGKAHYRDLKSAVRLAFPYVVAVIIPTSLGLQTHAWFGEWNVIAAWGFADPKNVTITRLVSLFFGPMLGVFWYFPFALVSAALLFATRKRLELMLCLLSVIATAALAATTANINSAQLSSPRYAIWFISPMVCLPFICRAFSPHSWTGVGKVTMAAASAICVATSIWLGTYRFLRGEWISFFSLNRAKPEVAALYRLTNFSDDVEAIVENIQGRELVVPHDFHGVYIWNLGARRSLWIVSKRAFRRGFPLRVQLQPANTYVVDELRAVFAVEDGSAIDAGVILRAREGVEFVSHPHFGGYVSLWLGAEVTSARGVGRVFVR